MARFRWVIWLVFVLLVALSGVGLGYFWFRDGPAAIPPVVKELTLDDKLTQYRQEHPAKDLPALDATVGPEDFPAYRGVHRDGLVPFAKLRPDWGEERPMLLWRRPCGGGFSGIAVAGNIAVTHEQRGKDEAVVCYDRATGQQRWSHAYAAHQNYTKGNIEGPRATPAIHNQRIFALGAAGNLVCLNIYGQLQWSVNVLDDSKAPSPAYGLCGSPLIVDDLVIVHAGADFTAPAGAALVAFEQASGKKRWHAGNRPVCYSSPQLISLAGTRQIVVCDARAVAGFDPGTGLELWHWPSMFGESAAQPLVLPDGRIFISPEGDGKCTMLRVSPSKADGKKWTIETLWQNKHLLPRFANPITDGTRIFGLHQNSGGLRCLDATDGKLLWKGPRYGAGQLLLDDNVLLVIADTGTLSLADTAAPAKLQENQFSVFDARTWNTPALAGDQLFIRNQAEIACVRLPRR